MWLVTPNHTGKKPASLDHLGLVALEQYVRMIGDRHCLIAQFKKGISWHSE
jgi:hypothetical protein